jgi:hypothetical protein
VKRVPFVESCRIASSNDVPGKKEGREEEE